MSWVGLPSAEDGVDAAGGLLCAGSDGGLWFYGYDSGAVPTLARYDLDSATWDLRTADTKWRIGHGMASVGGKIFVFASRDGNSGSFSSTATFTTRVYDIAGDSWSAGATMPTAGYTGTSRYGACAIPGDGDHVYVIGGSGSGSNSGHNNRNTRYDATGDSWANMADLPQGQDTGSAVYVPSENSLRVIGAFTQPSPHPRRASRKYDVAGNSYTDLTAMPSAMLDPNLCIPIVHPTEGDIWLTAARDFGFPADNRHLGRLTLADVWSHDAADDPPGSLDEMGAFGDALCAMPFGNGFVVASWSATWRWYVVDEEWSVLHELEDY